MKIKVFYYAILRDERGLGEETLETSVLTPKALYEELQKRYRFSLPVELVKVAVNNHFVDMNTAFKEGDSVVFIPPVAGG